MRKAPEVVRKDDLHSKLGSKKWRLIKLPRCWLLVLIEFVLDS